MTQDNDVRALLGRVGVLRHPSDLDLLLFFARHPRSLLLSEQLSSFVGYGIKEVAASLDLLVDAGVVTRTQSRRHAARLFVLAEVAHDHDWFPDLVTLARSREGRLALIWALKSGSEGTPAPARATHPAVAGEGPRPFLVGRKDKMAKRTRTG